MGDTSTTTDPMQQKVTNPEYTDLENLRSRIATAAPGLKAALDKPAQDMGGGKVWTGPVADTFGQEVSGRKQRLSSLVESLTSAVDAKLRSTPKECTLQEATNYHRYRRMDRY
jgi:hypothetical protein